MEWKEDRPGSALAAIEEMLFVLTSSVATVAVRFS